MTVSIILLIWSLGIGEMSQAAAGFCIRLNSSSSSAYMVLVTSGTNYDLERKCTWKMDYTLSGRTSNIVMIFKVLKSSSIGSSFRYKFWMNLPEHPDVAYSWGSSWCRIYVKNGSDVAKCKSLLDKSELCKNVMQTSPSWPPTIITDFYQFSAVMSYQFLDCDASVPVNCSHDSGAWWQETDNIETKTTAKAGAGMSVSATIGIVTANVVLAISCLLLLIAFWQNRRRNRSTRNSAAVSIRNNHSQNGLVSEQQGRNANILEHDYATVNAEATSSQHYNHGYLVPIQRPVPEYLDFEPR